MLHVAIKSDRGFTQIDILNVLVLMSLLLGMTALIGRRAVTGYQLNTAARQVARDLESAKVHAIKANELTRVRIESERRYLASGKLKKLPGSVRFGEASADSVIFNGLGAVADGAIHSLILVSPGGESREVRVYPAGGNEVKRL